MSEDSLYDELNAGLAQYEIEQKMFEDEDDQMKKDQKSTGLFEFIKDVLYRNETHDDYRGYVPHLVNQNLSFASQTVAYANEINKRHNLPVDVQFEFLRRAIPKTKSTFFIKWMKPTIEKDERIELIMKVYKYSYEKAKDVVNLINPDQYELLKQSFEKGGRG